MWVHFYGDLFSTVVEGPWRPICTVYAVYMGDVSIFGFGYPWGLLEPIPADIEGQLKFFGGQKLHAGF